MTLPVPPGGLGPVSSFLSLFRQAVDRELAQKTARDEALPYVHLTSPSGKIFRVTVSDGGALTTVQVS